MFHYGEGGGNLYSPHLSIRLPLWAATHAYHVLHKDSIMDQNWIAGNLKSEGLYWYEMEWKICVFLWRFFCFGIWSCKFEQLQFISFEHFKTLFWKFGILNLWACANEKVATENVKNSMQKLSLRWISLKSGNMLSSNLTDINWRWMPFLQLCWKKAAAKRWQHIDSRRSLPWSPPTKESECRVS